MVVGGGVNVAQDGVGRNVDVGDRCLVALDERTQGLVVGEGYKFGPQVGR